MEDIQKRILMTIIVGIVLIIVFYFITYNITKHTGFFVSEVKSPEDDFNACLKEQDITLYVNTEDLANTLKNIQVFEELENFKIKNCLRDNQECLEKGVISFPSWIINNIKMNRDISLEELSEYSGCKLIR